MVSIPEQILDREVSHWHSKISFKNPGSKSGWDWHQDFGHWYREGCLSPDMLSIGIALTPMNQDNGSLNFIRCSHKFGRIDHIPTGHSNSSMYPISWRCSGISLQLITWFRPKLNRKAQKFDYVQL